MNDLTDRQINEKLAAAMFRRNTNKPVSWCSAWKISERDIDYKDHAIFAENVAFLVEKFGKIELKDGDIFKQTALAIIEAANIEAKNANHP